jgi:SAM-dependent methyltransferase
VASAYGRVLELGPATGNQLPRFDFSKIQHIYGVESNASFEPDMQSKIKELGVEDKYTPLMFSIEDEAQLRKHGIEEGSIDCIVSIQVLCSVDDVDKAAKLLHRLLKPGGELILWEHQKSFDGLTRILQSKCLISNSVALSLLIYRANVWFDLT